MKNMYREKKKEKNNATTMYDIYYYGLDKMDLTTIPYRKSPIL